MGRNPRVRNRIPRSGFNSRRARHCSNIILTGHDLDEKGRWLFQPRKIPPLHHLGGVKPIAFDEFHQVACRTCQRASEKRWSFTACTLKPHTHIDPRAKAEENLLGYIDRDIKRVRQVPIIGRLAKLYLARVRAFALCRRDKTRCGYYYC